MLAGVVLDVFINLQLHSQRLQQLLGVGQLLPLELHLTLQPGIKKLGMSLNTLIQL